MRYNGLLKQSPGLPQPKRRKSLWDDKLVCEVPIDVSARALHRGLCAMVADGVLHLTSLPPNRSTAERLYCSYATMEGAVSIFAKPVSEDVQATVYSAVCGYAPPADPTRMTKVSLTNRDVRGIVALWAFPGTSDKFPTTQRDIRSAIASLVPALGVRVIRATVADIDERIASRIAKMRAV